MPTFVRIAFSRVVLASLRLVFMLLLLVLLSRSFPLPLARLCLQVMKTFFSVISYDALSFRLSFKPFNVARTFQRLSRSSRPLVLQNSKDKSRMESFKRQILLSDPFGSFLWIVSKTVEERIVNADEPLLNADPIKPKLHEGSEIQQAVLCGLLESSRPPSHSRARIAKNMQRTLSCMQVSFDQSSLAA